MQSRLFKFCYLWLILFSNMQTESSQLQWSWAQPVPLLLFQIPLLNFMQRLPWKTEHLTISLFQSRPCLSLWNGLNFWEELNKFQDVETGYIPSSLKLNCNNMASLLGHFAWRKFPEYQTHPHASKIIKPFFKAKYFFKIHYSELYSSVSLS